MPCTGPVQQEVLAQILRQRTASEYRKTHRGRSPCGPSAQAREPRRGLIKIKRRRRAAPIRPPHRTMPQDAERPARDDPPAVPARPTMPGGGRMHRNADRAASEAATSPRREKARRGDPPAGLLGACGACGACGAHAHVEKRPPRARRPALPQPCAAVLSAKAGLTAGFGMGPGDPRLCGRARGGRSPAAQMYSSLPGTPVRGDPGGRMAGTGEDHASRSVLFIEDAKSSGY